MGNSYYYFAASLPMIDWEGKLPMPSEEFLLTARRILVEEDYTIIESLIRKDVDPRELSNPTACSWATFSRNFHNEIAWFRAKRAGQDPFQSIHGDRGNEVFLKEAVQQASKMSNLMEAEKSLDKISWQFLDDLGASHYYDLEFLIVYGLKLKILERHEGYKSSKGKDFIDEVKEIELPESCLV